MTAIELTPGASRRTARNAKPSTGQRFEGIVLVFILLVVGGFAGAASFTHVHDWTMANSPAQTGDWFGWANAVVSELVPIAALLVMRRRRRAHQSITYPAFLLVTALALSITAQLAVAKPGFFGGLVSVVPALAFAALAKLVLGKTPAPEPVTVVPVPVVNQPPAATVPIVQDRPVPAQQATPVQDDHPPISAPSTQDDQRKVIALSSSPIPQRTRPTVRTLPSPPLPAHLLTNAREAADRHLAETGRAISRDELQKILRVSNATTGDVMRALDLHDSPRPLASAAAISPLTGKPLI